MLFRSMKEGVEADQYGCYVCSAETYAELETTPRESGDARMILENGKINGYPVFVTEYINKAVDGAVTEHILGFGIFNYELLGQFGNMRMTIDPYTGASKDTTYFVFNTQYDMLTVRPEAFATLSKAVTAASGGSDSGSGSGSGSGSN